MVEYLPPALAAKLSARARSVKKVSPYFLDMLAKQGGRCAYCYLQDYRVFTVDHVVPKEHGGDGATSNKVLACMRCNSKKRRLSVSDFKRLHQQHLRNRIHTAVQEMRSQVK